MFRFLVYAMVGKLASHGDKTNVLARTSVWLLLHGSEAAMAEVGHLGGSG